MHEQTAKNFIDTCSNIRPPVNIEKIVLQLGIKVFYKKLHSNINGFVIKDGDGFTILIDTDISLEKQRLTIGHELKHIIYGELGQINPDHKHQIESDADNFSRDILVHTKWLLHYYSNNLITSISELSRLFLVEECDIRYKLKKEGIKVF